MAGTSLPETPATLELPESPEMLALWQCPNGRKTVLAGMPAAC